MSNYYYHHRHHRHHHRNGIGTTIGRIIHAVIAAAIVVGVIQLMKMNNLTEKNSHDGAVDFGSAPPIANLTR